MVFRSVMWCSSGGERVITRLVALVARWKQFLRKLLAGSGRGVTLHAPVWESIMVFGHTGACKVTPLPEPEKNPLKDEESKNTIDSQQEPAQVCATLPIDEQETQICRAVIPVKTHVDEAVSLIVVHNLKKTYQCAGVAQIALTGLSFEVAQGEFVVVTGPPGAGKSTLLHILGCMLQRSAGFYSLGGSTVSLFPADKLATLRNQRIGFIWREPALLPHVSALENVALPLLYAGFSEAEQKRRAQKVLQFVGLSSCLLATPEKLSAGQRQRVAIARALVNSPALLCADDPTGNMDTRSGREIMAVLQALNQRKLTIVMGTQNVDLAVYAKRHMVLDAGCIASDTQVTTMRIALDDLPAPTALVPVVKDKGISTNV